MAQRPAGESVFNIFHNLLVGADAKLQSDLQLDIPVGDSTNAYINLDQHGDVREEKGEGGKGRGGREGRKGYLVVYSNKNHSHKPQQCYMYI